MAEWKTSLGQAFERAFGRAADLFVRAPGRVNLIGEHTDYNDGFVLPMAISGETRIAAARRTDGQVRVLALDLESAINSFGLDDQIATDPSAPWSNYVRGVAHGLLTDGLPMTGADLAIAGTVPQGAGLSSSASLEVAAGLAFAALAGEPDHDRTHLARIGQRAEHDFAGCQCGIMDQLASARAEQGRALLIDCRTLDAQPVTLPNDMALMIVHSGVSRGLVEGAYNERRAQCEEAARHYGVTALRDLDVVRLEQHKTGLSPIVHARARHVVTENARVLDFAAALQRGDRAALSDLMAQSHASMRVDFEITVPAIDTLVELIAGLVGLEGGARMTGGGFGGAVVALVPNDQLDVIREAIRRGYQTPAGCAPLIMIETACAGASLV